jgi:hypothetical protein
VKAGKGSERRGVREGEREKGRQRRAGEKGRERRGYPLRQNILTDGKYVSGR